MSAEIEVELVQVVFDETKDQQTIRLREKNGSRSFQIIIGTHEAVEIHRKLLGRTAPRPLTHDLIGQVLHITGSEIERVVVSDLRNGTFYATIYLSLVNGETAPVDARPSDAIALAIANNCAQRLFVMEHVFDELSHG